MIPVNTFTDRTKPISVFESQDEWRVLSLFINEFAATFVWGVWAFVSAMAVPAFTCDQDARCESVTIKAINMLALMFVFASAYEKMAEEHVGKHSSKAKNL